MKFFKYDDRIVESFKDCKDHVIKSSTFVNYDHFRGCKMNGTKKKIFTLCGSANCMNKGYFENYLVRWFYGGEYSKKYIPLCPKCVPLWKNEIISKKEF